jgi:hypothetical protein
MGDEQSRKKRVSRAFVLLRAMFMRTFLRRSRYTGVSYLKSKWFAEEFMKFESEEFDVLDTDVP